jgi:hypothetical protein
LPGGKGSNMPALPDVLGYPSVLTIDAGANLGWAFGRSRWLEACGLYDAVSRGQEPWLVIPWAACVVVESPQAQKGDSLARQNDLYKCTQRGASVAGALRPSVLYFVWPHDWKGSVPKDVHNQRVLDRLSPEEAEIYRKASAGVVESKKNNIIDAIGLFLVLVKRW